MDTTIRNIDPSIYKKLKAKAAAEGITIGEAINRALRAWMNLKTEKQYSLLDIKPEHFGPHNRRLSEEIDEVLYREEMA